MSRSSSPWSSQQQQRNGNYGGSSNSGQLLQELEALSQALYQSQSKGSTPYDTAAAAVVQSQSPSSNVAVGSSNYKQRSTSTTASEIFKGRRYSSSSSHGVPALRHGHRDDDDGPQHLAAFADPIANSTFNPTMPIPAGQYSRNRHSISSAPPPNLAAGRGLAMAKPSASSTSPQRTPAAASAEQSSKHNIRSQIDRRLSLQQPWQSSKPAVLATVEKPLPPPQDPYPIESPRQSVDSVSHPAASDHPADKKKRAWNNWKPLRALSHIGRHRLHCVFSVYVHAIQGIPAMMNGLRLCVHLRKEETKEGAVQTMPSRIFQGIADFQETLTIKCTLYSSNNKGNSVSSSKFMEKAVIISVVSPDIDELDFGKHQLDLSRLLSDLVDDSNGQIEKGRSWETNLDLTGKAKGAKLVVTFHYEVVDKESSSISAGGTSSRFHGSPPRRSSLSSRITTSFSLPNSAHNSPRLTTKMAHLGHSPTVSEPGDDYDHSLFLDHLSLDEPPSPAPLQGLHDHTRPGHVETLDQLHSLNHSRFVQPPVFSPRDVTYKDARTVNTEVESPKPDSDLLPAVTSSQSLRPADSSGNGSSDPVNQEEDESSEDDADFSVVEQGMEINEVVIKVSSMNEVTENPTIEKPEIKPAELVVRETTGNDAHAYDVNKESADDEEKIPDVAGNAEKLLGPEVFTGNEQCSAESDSSITDREVLESPTSETNVNGNERAADKINLKLNLVESHLVDDDKIADVDQGDKKDDVTYQTVMQTLDSLLQGTSAKEQPEEEEEEAMDVLTKISSSSRSLSDGGHGGSGTEEEDLKKEQAFIDAPSSLNESIAPNVSTAVIPTEIPEGDNGKKDLREENLPASEDIDSEADLVAGEFLDMLDLVGDTTDKNYESEQDSPRARLLKEFEQESLVFSLDLGMMQESEPDKSPKLSALHVDTTPSATPLRNSPELALSDIADTGDRRREPLKREDQNLDAIAGVAKPADHQWASQSIRSKTRAKLLEDAETEALMQEWGFDEKAFSSSPPPTPKIKQQDPPPLGRGLGASVPLKDGGSLKSMSPSHFQASKGSGKLVMQMSKPVVIPAEMGSEAVDILRNMVSMGVENMAAQAMTAMPLEDIAGRPMEQVAMEGIEAAKFRRKALEGPVAGKELQWSSTKPPPYGMGEVVSLEDLAPMAMQQIESLALDGLKIQSNVDDDENEAPSTIDAFSYGNKLDGNNTGVVTGVHLHKGSGQTSSKETGDLMDMAISLDEWMLLDAGLYDEVETNKNAMAIMAAHHANHQELAVVDEEDRKSRTQNAKAKWGSMGNTVTIAMLVQLRDPLKNNEAVGVPMMAFVQAERLMKPPKVKVGRNVSLKGNTEEEDEGEEGATKKKEGAEASIPQFKVINVHMAGLKAGEGEEEEDRVGESEAATDSVSLAASQWYVQGS